MIFILNFLLFCVFFGIHNINTRPYFTDRTIVIIIISNHILLYVGCSSGGWGFHKHELCTVVGKKVFIFLVIADNDITAFVHVYWYTIILCVHFVLILLLPLAISLSYRNGRRIVATPLPPMSAIITYIVTAFDTLQEVCNLP